MAEHYTFNKTNKKQLWEYLEKRRLSSNLENETLSVRLQEAVRTMATHDGNLTAEEVLWHTDSRKFRSSLTLFDMVKPDDIYSECLDKFFEGKRCRRTLEMFAEEISTYWGQTALERIKGTGHDGKGFFESGRAEY